MKSKWFGEIKEPETELNRVVRGYLEYELDQFERGEAAMAYLAALVTSDEKQPKGDVIHIRRPVHFNAN